MLSPTVRWTLQRIALLDSPLLMIAAVASLFTDRPLLGIALALLSFAFFMAGRETIGHRHGPPEQTTPLERSRARRPPRVGTPPPEDTGATTRPRRRRRDFRGF
ncbi:MAG TPA: hypothetical protein VF712_14760 [Thermoleophilaceae bacterium]